MNGNAIFGQLLGVKESYRRSGYEDTDEMEEQTPQTLNHVNGESLRKLWK